MKKKVEATKSKYAGMRGGYKGGGRKAPIGGRRKIRGVALNDLEFETVKAAATQADKPVQAFIREHILEVSKRLIK